ncbi:hypothetical protein ACTFQF_00775 [Aliivibrio fischeri]|uniref:Uncharacterized protein n=1 Tax=Aliivibrio fischeri (strain MJ11) TaxID=388396 RepID=B5EW90_ALIFM|nr:hypothetical protein [Aliivibrio fischeri]ACH64775.1 hypothetical protein VFMJ11_B0147 [Aliivibrio fischeri MJ11]MUK37586.1 hypothetical protein [Aliivibrio fischeri]
MEAYDDTYQPPVLSINKDAKLRFLPMKPNLPHQIAHENIHLNNVPFLPILEAEPITLSTEVTQVFLHLYHELTNGKKLKNYLLSSDRTSVISQQSGNYPVLALIKSQDWFNTIIYQSNDLKVDERPEISDEVNLAFKKMMDWRWDHEACVIMLSLES